MTTLFSIPSSFKGAEKVAEDSETLVSFEPVFEWTEEGIARLFPYQEGFLGKNLLGREYVRPLSIVSANGSIRCYKKAFIVSIPSISFGLGSALGKIVLRVFEVSNRPLVGSESTDFMDVACRINLSSGPFSVFWRGEKINSISDAKVSFEFKINKFSSEVFCIEKINPRVTLQSALWNISSLFDNAYRRGCSLRKSGAELCIDSSVQVSFPNATIVYSGNGRFVFESNSFYRESVFSVKPKLKNK